MYPKIVTVAAYPKDNENVFACPFAWMLVFNPYTNGSPSVPFAPSSGSWVSGCNNLESTFMYYLPSSSEKVEFTDGSVVASGIGFASTTVEMKTFPTRRIGAAAFTKNDDMTSWDELWLVFRPLSDSSTNLRFGGSLTLEEIF